jgi:hypothetical protein
MNRVQSPKFPNTVCGVVGQKNQFAPGVLSKPMKESRSRALAEKAARDVLNGKRHRGVGKAMFFHTAGYSFPYRNMHYMVIAGGNAFYDKRNAPPGQTNRTQIEVAQAAARRSRPAPPVEIAVATVPAPREVQVAQFAAPPPPRLPQPAPAVPVAAPAPPPLLPADLLSPAAPPLAAFPAGEPTSIEELILLGGG